MASHTQASAHAGAGETDFQLLETLLWEPGEGVYLLDRHAARMREAAQAFDFAEPDLAAAVRDLEAGFVDEPVRIRALGYCDGRVEVQGSPVAGHTGPWRVGLARTAVDSADPFLHHKTTRRRVYDVAAAERPDCDDVLLVNERGEVTETTIGNLVIVRDGQRLTPARRCGLLAGTFRDALIADGQLAEAVLSVDDVAGCAEMYVINSVRRWLLVEWVP